MAVKNLTNTQKYRPHVKDVIAKIIQTILWALLVIYCLSLLVLPIYMLLTAFKLDNIECVTTPFGFPQKPRLENFGVIFKIIEEKMEFSILSMASISIIMSTVKPAIAILFTVFFAYVEAKYEFVGKKFLFSFGIVIMIIPIVGNLASAMQIQKAIGMYDNVFMNIILSPVGCFYGTNFLLFYAAFKQMPWDYAESVFIDGGSNYTALFRIYFPMILPTALSIFVLAFMGAWNDYGTYMVWLPHHPNIAYGMYLFYRKANQFRVSLPELMAGFTVVMIPTIVLYLLTHNIITSKIFVGGLKG